MNKNILFLLFVIFTVQLAAAADVAYIVEDERDAEPNIELVFFELGLHYDIIEEDDIPSTNFDDYDILVIGDNNFDHPEDIPVNEIRTIILNHYNTNGDWGWSTSIGSVTSIPFTTVMVDDPGHQIFDDVGLEWVAYDQPNIPAYYLNGQKAAGLDLLAHKQGSNTGDAIIALALEGTQYKNGKTEQTKSIFYGLIKSDFWTGDSKLIFKNMLEFLISDLDQTPPGSPVNLVLELENDDAILKWEAPAGEAVEVYNIYRSSTPEGFNFDQPLASTSSLTFTDPNILTNKYYVVRSEDAVGNEEANMDIVGKYFLFLDEGVNLITFPLILFDNDIEEITEIEAGFQPITEITKFENNEFETAVYNGNNWIGFTDLENDNGYFFTVSVDYNFPIAGSVPVEDRTIHLVNGMNLIGFSTLEQKEIKDFIAQDPAVFSVVEIAKFNNGVYDLSTFYPDNDPDFWFSVAGLENLEPGTGYWFKTNNFISMEYAP